MKPKLATPVTMSDISQALAQQLDLAFRRAVAVRDRSDRVLLVPSVSRVSSVEPVISGVSRSGVHAGA